MSDLSVALVVVILVGILYFASRAAGFEGLPIVCLVVLFVVIATSIGLDTISEFISNLIKAAFVLAIVGIVVATVKAR